MNPTDELVKLIEVIVDKKVRAATLNIKNITSAGDLALTSMGDIRIQTAGTHKAYYNGTEIGTGAGGITGSGTTNYIPKFTGASAIGNSSITDDGTTITTTAQSIVQNATAPGLILQSGGIDKTYLYFSTSSILRSIDTDLMLRAQDSTKSIINRIGTVDKLTIADNLITAAVQSFVLDATAPGYILSSATIDKSYFYFSTDTILRSLDTDLILKADDITKSIRHRIGTVDKLIINNTQIISSTHLYTNAKSIYIFDGDPNGAGTSRLSLTYLGNDGRIIGTNGYLKLAGASGIIAEDPIAMSSSKITGLAAGTVDGDAISFQDSSRIYLNSTKTAWLIMNGNDCELHLPAGGAFVTVIE